MENPNQNLSSPKEKFVKGFQKSLNDPQLRKNFRNASFALKSMRQTAFPDEAAFKELQELGHRIKMKALKNLGPLLRQLEQKCQEKGIQVHWAESTDEANQIVLEICQRNNAASVIKGKSMVTEEMHLNHFLEQHKIEAIETDLGEYIIQLDHETPSHIIAPAIHKDKKQIAQLFNDKIEGAGYTEVYEELNAIARKSLRKKFYKADVGITGVNFAIAETGTICLVENEGNGRMCSTLPPVHIAVMGMEKVIPTLEELPPLLTLLARSATGQPISTYFNMINSPRKEGEKDGPKEVHLVILDNRRSQIYQDEHLQKTLLCIRCGACLNHCPVYSRIGGHAYNQVYPGPIGKILAPQMNGLESTGGVHNASSLCGACGEVCPVKIPIPEILLRLRYEGVNKSRSSKVHEHGTQQNFKESMAWKFWEKIHASPVLYKTNSGLGNLLNSVMPKNAGPLKNWSEFREVPQFAAKSLHQLAREKGVADE
ncbi:MAG: iron-sulfur cluster-binding protein [SAR324 cluster bacterium]|nr:iron-sulfur cluster-binding protein [SAR324 cluster bacterium]